MPAEKIESIQFIIGIFSFVVYTLKGCINLHKILRAECRFRNKLHFLASQD